MITLTTQVKNQTRSKIAARIFNSEVKSENNDQFDVVHLYNWQCKHVIFRDINKGVSECAIENAFQIRYRIANTSTTSGQHLVCQLEHRNERKHDINIPQQKDTKHRSKGNETGTLTSVCCVYKKNKTTIGKLYNEHYKDSVYNYAEKVLQEPYNGKQMSGELHQVSWSPE